ncbi:hypothetical protein [Hyphomonas sp.]|uniref:hypothetical protein n=1 Tax=Hyphomonas sp. TaxID=87 RepID=UPI003918EA07
MRRVLMILMTAGLVACAPEAVEVPAEVVEVAEVAAPATLDEFHASMDWQAGPGETLEADCANAVHTLLRPGGRAAALSALQAAGYECIYGEAHEDYPEPAAQCTRSFATRACQFDWEVFVTSDPARPDSVETTDSSFRRDCVGTADDWPDAMESAIDDQLAPPPALEPEPV